MKKKSYFEVSSVVNRWLTVGLVLVIVSLMLSQWSSTFTAASDAIAGSFGKALNTFMRTAVGNGVVSVLFGVGHVLLLEFFRRGMRCSGDRFWVLVALWEVLIGASSLVTAVPWRDTLYAYAHNPTAWDSFRETFLLNYRVLAGMVQLLVSCLCIVRYRGRIRLFGITKLICSLLVSLVGVLFYNWALQATDQQGVILTSYYALQVLMAIIPLVFLRLSMSTRITVQPAEGDSDMQSL